MQVRIVGAGFSGLTAAYYLRAAGWDVTLHEREAGAGGMISTTQLSHSLVESAASAVLNSVALMQLARAAGVELVGTRPEARARFIYRGKPRTWPLSVGESLSFAIGALRFFCGFNAAKPRPDETLASWGQRVLGKAALDYLVAPALQGIYAASPAELSAALILGSLKPRRSARGRAHPSGSVAPRGGMGELIQALQALLLKQGVRIESSRAISSADIAGGGTWILATSHADAVHLLAQAHPGASANLGRVGRVPLASATLVFEKEAIRYPGFGCLFPRAEGFRALGVLSNTHIFPGRTDKHSETWIFSGAEVPRALAGSDAEVIALALADRARLTQANHAPLESKVTRWPGGIPRYDATLAAFLAGGTVTELEERGIFLHGNYLGRLGLAGILARSMDLPNRLKRIYGT